MIFFQLLFLSFFATATPAAPSLFLHSVSSLDPLELEDGSWLIMEPRYSKSQADGQEISFSVDRGFLCRTLGFAYGVFADPIDTKKPVVSFSPHSSQVTNLSKNEPGGGFRYQSVVCRDDGAKILGRVSKKADQITPHADQSLTIVKPAISWIKVKGKSTSQEKLSISAASDLRGVCLLYGRDSYRAGTIKTGSVGERALVINYYGRLEQFASANFLEITEITCEGNQQERFAESFSPMTLNRSLKEMSEFVYPVYQHAIEQYLKVSTQAISTRSWAVHAYRMTLWKGFVERLDSAVIQELIFPRISEAVKSAFEQVGAANVASLPRSEEMALSAVEVIQSMVLTLLQEAHFDASTAELLVQINSDASKIVALGSLVGKLSIDTQMLKNLTDHIVQFNSVIGFGRGATTIQDLKEYLPLVQTIEVGYQTLVNFYPEVNQK